MKKTVCLILAFLIGTGLSACSTAATETPSPVQLTIAVSQDLRSNDTARMDSLISSFTDANNCNIVVENLEDCETADLYLYDPQKTNDIGATENLLTYIDQDETISQAYFVGNTLQSILSDNTLDFIPLEFYIQTLIASPSAEGAASNLKNAVESHGFSLEESITGSSLFFYILPSLIGPRIRSADAAFDLTGTAFEDVIAFCGNLPMQTKEASPVISMHTMVSIGNFMSITAPDSGIECINRYDNSTYITSFHFPICAAISSGSQQKELAWAFIRTLLAEDVQRQMNGFPIAQVGFDAQIESMLLSDKFNADDEARLSSLVQNTSDSDLLPSSLANALLSEANSCFEKEQSIPQTIENIQRAIELYLKN